MVHNTLMLSASTEIRWETCIREPRNASGSSEQYATKTSLMLSLIAILQAYLANADQNHDLLVRVYGNNKQP